MRYYLIRVGTKCYHWRCEKAKGPREACRLAYGVVYDRPLDTCRYKDMGTRKPAYLPQKIVQKMYHEPEGYLPIPRTGD